MQLDMNSMICMQPSDRSNNSIDMVTLGERGQVVIPLSIRERLSLRAGDKMMVFTKHGEVVCLVPASSMRHLVDVLTAQLSEIDEQPNKPQEGE
jgi:AbrB family looped-hinge helix DNA binding protein